MFCEMVTSHQLESINQWKAVTPASHLLIGELYTADTEGIGNCIPRRSGPQQIRRGSKKLSLALIQISTAYERT